MILLDTSMLLAAFGRPAAHGDHGAATTLRRLIESGAPLAIPAMVVQEVLAAAQGAAQADELRSHLVAYSLLPATLDQHLRAARIAGQCAARGVFCSTVAALVAAQALAHGAELLTLDLELVAVAQVAGVKLCRLRARGAIGLDASSRPS